MTQKRKLLILGGSGFIGKSIVECFKQRKLSKPSIIREKTERKKRKMVKLKEGDYVRFVNDKSKEGIVRFIGEVCISFMF